MANLGIAECNVNIGDTEIYHYFFMAVDSGTDDLYESAFLSIYPSILEDMWKNERYSHPQTKIATTHYREGKEITYLDVPSTVMSKYMKRKDNTKYIEILRKIQVLFDEIVEQYEESYAKSSEGIVVCNYCNTPWEKRAHINSKPFKKAEDMNPLAFQAIKCFIALQKLPPSKPIPKYITKFFEQYEALKLLES